MTHFVTDGYLIYEEDTKSGHRGDPLTPHTTKLRYYNVITRIYGQQLVSGKVPFPCYSTPPSCHKSKSKCLAWLVTTINSLIGNKRGQRKIVFGRGRETVERKKYSV